MGILKDKDLKAIHRGEVVPDKSKLSDGEGLYIKLKPLKNSGMGIYWRFDYQFAGKRKTLPIGTFPLITITEARKTHREAKVGHTKQFYPNEYSPNVYNRMVGELADKAVNYPCDFDELPAYRITDSDWQRINLFRAEREPHIEKLASTAPRPCAGMSPRWIFTS